MRFAIAPLIAALLLGVSGFLHELEETTVTSVELARVGEEAPATTEKAAEKVADLPGIALLTTRQADAFETLADALEVSARRVFSLNEALVEQAASIGDLAAGTRELEDPLGCVERRLRRLVGIAGRIPPRLEAIRPLLADLTSAQRKSIRHLRSINRKLTALGVVARASRVKVPPVPEAPPFGIEGGEPGSQPC